MASSLLPNAKAYFTDANGIPLVGGKVYFYIPNTTTPKDTYQDAAQTILNTNPVILDSSGRAVIWGNGSYRQVVYDSLNNLIWDQVTQDANAGLVGNLTDQTFIAGTDFTPGTTTQLTLSAYFESASNLWVDFDGAAQHGFTLSGTTLTFSSAIPTGVRKVYVKGGNTIAIGHVSAGTITNTEVAPNAGIVSTKLNHTDPRGYTQSVSSVLNLYLGEHINVKDPRYGAKGDGTTDDSDAIDAAFHDAVTLGIDLFFPTGIYKYTRNLYWDFGPVWTTGIRVYGEGMQSSVIDLQTVTAAPAALFGCATSGSSPAKAAFGSEITHMGFRGNCAGPALQLGDNANNEQLNEFTFNLCVVNYSLLDGACGLKVNGVYNSWFYGIYDANLLGGAGVCDAIQLRWSQFNTFFGSYSGALVGIHFYDQYSYANVFIALDVENISDDGYAVAFDSDHTYQNLFVGGQFVAKNFVRATSAGQNNIFDTPNLTGNITPTTVLTGADFAAVRIRNPSVSQVATPTFPASGTWVQNTSGERVNVMMWNGAVSFVHLNGSTFTTLPTGGFMTFILNNGDSIRPDYTGSPIWEWKSIS